jgi:hypothetical protein
MGCTGCGELVERREEEKQVVSRNHAEIKTKSQLTGMKIIHFTQTLFFFLTEKMDCRKESQSKDTSATTTSKSEDLNAPFKVRKKPGRKPNPQSPAIRK